VEKKTGPRKIDVGGGGQEDMTRDRLLTSKPGTGKRKIEAGSTPP
jgi:hypothetical protein